MQKKSFNYLLKTIVFFVLALSLSSCNNLQPSPYSYEKAQLTGPYPLSIMQGYTTDTQTEIIILAHKGKKYNFSILEKNLKNKKSNKKRTPIPYKLKTKNIAKSKYKLFIFLLSKLSPNKPYELKVTDSLNKTIDQRTFQTLKINKTNLSIVVASCLDYKYEKEQKIIWNTVVQKKPDLIFMIGDNMYPWKMEFIKGPNTPQSLWNGFTNTRIRLEIFHQPKLTPILATWDDHDFGLNNGGADFVYKKESAEVTRSFFGPYGNYPSLKRGPGVSFNFTGFGTQFIFLDNRSFRTHPKALEGSHWGPAQERWVYNQLQSKKPTWLIQGDQFFGGYHHFESYEKLHNKSFKKMLSKLSQLPSPVFFVSGDRHLFELMKSTPKDLPYTTYEMTTSGIHARVFKHSSSEKNNPRRIKKIPNRIHFALVHLNSKKSKMKMQIKAIGMNGENLYSKSVNISRNKLSSTRNSVTKKTNKK